ncbi:MAG: LacI family DNA-binding transcriptional regulator [Candidatus Caldatribacteriaceae bacterium]
MVKKVKQPGTTKDKITINDIAWEAGVSKATVSRVLNNPGKVAEETRRKVLEAIQRRNYRPNPLARALTVKKTGVIGVVVSDISNPFYAVMVRSIEEVCRAHAYHIFLCNTDGRDEEEEFYIDSLIEKRVDGIILGSVHLESKSFEKLKEAEIPFIFVSRLPRNREECDYVMIDNVLGGYMATRYLLSLGHTRIAYLGGRWNTSSNLDRFEGYKKALQEVGIEIKEEYIRCGEFSMEGGYREGLRIIDSGERRPTAVFCANDAMAIGLLEACREGKIRVPEELSVIGFDDIPLSALGCIQLTTVSQSIADLGALSGKMIIDKITDAEKRNTKQQVVFPPKLVVRKTCTRISGKGGINPRR